MANGVIRLNEGWRMNEGHRMDEPPNPTPVVPPSVHRKRGIIMPGDFVPHQRAAEYLWFKNLSTNVTPEAVKFNAGTGQATAVKAAADSVIPKMDATDAAQEVVDAARIAENNAIAAALQVIRPIVKNWKTLPGWAASGSETVLQLSGSGSEIHPDAYKSTIKLSTAADGGVRVAFVKKGVEGVNIYERVAGTTAWHKAGMANHSPFIDHTPVTQTGVSESREYMVKGVVKDAEVGQGSDIATITVSA